MIFNFVAAGRFSMGRNQGKLCWKSVVLTSKEGLVGGDWNMTGVFFHSVGNVIIPIDELIFFRGV